METFGTVIIGGGQAGLSTAYHLRRRGLDCVVLEATPAVGDVWRARYDSLRLFSPARYDGLDGMPFPAKGSTFPGKDELAAYLEDYVARQDLPVRTGVRVDAVTRHGDGWLVSAGEQRFAAANVVLATGTYQEPFVPAFAAELDPRIVQLHSSGFRNAGQFVPGAVLVVGAGNSGADVALQAAAAGHRTVLAGRHVGQLPWDLDGWLSRHVMTRLVMRFAFHRVLTLRNPVGRKVRPAVLHKGGPLVRHRTKDYTKAGIERAGRVTGVRDGLPVLAGGDVPEVANVVWCTGFRHDWSWVEGLGAEEPEHVRGEVTGQPGLYLVGLHYLYAMSSAMIHGVGRDADHVAGRIARRAPVRQVRTAQRTAG